MQILRAGTEWEMGCDSKARQKVSCERRRRRGRRRTRRQRRRRRMGDRQTQQAFTASLDTGESRGAITSAQRLLVLTIPLLIPPLISPLVPSPLAGKKKMHQSISSSSSLLFFLFGPVYDSPMVVLLSPPPPRFFLPHSGQGVPALV